MEMSLLRPLYDKFNLINGYNCKEIPQIQLY